MKGRKPLQRAMTIPCSSSQNEQNAATKKFKLCLNLRSNKVQIFLSIEIKNLMNIMAEENVMAEVMSLLEAEPAAALPAPGPGPDIPAIREQFAILVSTGKCKEAIGVNLTHEQVRRLEDKDVMKYCKRCEAHVGAKTVETLIESFLSFSVKALSLVVRIKDTEALHNELKNDYIITKELSNLSGNLALRCGRLLAVANSVLISAKHVDFSAEEPRHPSRDSDGYPLAGLDEVPSAKQSSANAE